jgi:hypothetical protein
MGNVVQAKRSKEGSTLKDYIKGLFGMLFLNSIPE